MADSIVIPADVDTILEVVADVEAYPQWQPEVRRVDVLETDEDGWVTKASFEVDAKIVTARYTLAYRYTPTSMTWHLVSGEPIKRNDGAYEFTDQGDGTTLVTYRVEIDAGIPVPGLLRRQASKRIVDAGLRGLKRRVESLAA